MSKVIFDISMSLDGFMTAANRRPEEPIGDGGLRLVEWAIGQIQLEPIDVIDTPAATHLRFRVVK
jgi:hypothetical protein